MTIFGIQSSFYFCATWTGSSKSNLFQRKPNLFSTRLSLFQKGLDFFKLCADLLLIDFFAQFLDAIIVDVVIIAHQLVNAAVWCDFDNTIGDGVDKFVVV